MLMGIFFLPVIKPDTPSTTSTTHTEEEYFALQSKPETLEVPNLRSSEPRSIFADLFGSIFATTKTDKGTMFVSFRELIKILKDHFV